MTCEKCSVCGLVLENHDSIMAESCVNRSFASSYEINMTYLLQIITHENMFVIVGFSQMLALVVALITFNVMFMFKYSPKRERVVVAIFTTTIVVSVICMVVGVINLINSSVELHASRVLIGELMETLKNK